MLQVPVYEFTPITGMNQYYCEFPSRNSGGMCRAYPCEWIVKPISGEVPVDYPTFVCETHRASLVALSLPDGKEVTIHAKNWLVLASGSVNKDNAIGHKEAAEAKARKLATSTPGAIYVVYEAVGAYKASIPTPILRELKVEEYTEK